MFIEFIDLLRCPHDHEETWLVAAFNTMSGRFVHQGTLGCPVCHATYEIRNGVADLRIDTGPLLTTDRARNHDDQEATMRLAAFLNLTRPGSLVVLVGNHADAAESIAELTQSRVITINSLVDAKDSELTSPTLADARLPLAAASVDGIALSDDSFGPDITRVLKPGGRVILPVHSELPAGLNELARDDTYVVAESVGPLVGLTGKSRR